MRLKVTVNGVSYDVEVEVEEETRQPLGAIFMGGGFVPQHAAAAAGASGGTGAAGAGGAGGEGVSAPLAGTVVRVQVKPGQEVSEGDVLVSLEAMKMETEITATTSGTVSEVLVSVGDAVAGGQLLVRIDPAS